MASLKNHPALWLRDDAAKAFDRAEADHGIFVVKSAGRTIEQQQRLIDRWDQGGRYNRPPYLYYPARPAATSNHVRDGGVAIDLGDWQRFAKICEDYGFEHTRPSGDPVHFDFVGAPITVVIPVFDDEEDEDDMAKAVGHYIGGSAATPAAERLCVIYYPASGFYTLFSGVSQDYINQQARAHQTGNFTHLSVDQWNRTVQPHLDLLLRKQ